MSTTSDDLPDDKFTPSTILDPYRAEIARLRGLLVNACVDIACMWHVNSLDADVCIGEIFEDYGIHLRWNGAGFEEDTTK